MSRENSKIFTYAFCKSGALQTHLPRLTPADPQTPGASGTEWEPRNACVLGHVHCEITRRGAPVRTGIGGARWVGPEPEAHVRDEVMAVDVRRGG